MPLPLPHSCPSPPHSCPSPHPPTLTPLTLYMFSTQSLDNSKRTGICPYAPRDGEKTFLIIGGGNPYPYLMYLLLSHSHSPGPAGVECAETLRREGFKGKVIIASRETVLPYDRPKLSKVCSLYIICVRHAWCVCVCVCVCVVCVYVCVWCVYVCVCVWCVCMCVWCVYVCVWCVCVCVCVCMYTHTCACMHGYTCKKLIAKEKWFLWLVLTLALFRTTGNECYCRVHCPQI